MAVAYNVAKAGLVESLSFTLRGLPNFTKSLTDMSKLSSVSEVMIKPPGCNSPEVDPELKGILSGNLNTHNIDSKLAVKTMPWLFVDKPLASTNSDEAFIPHAEVVDIIEDPDISTAEGDVLRGNKRHLTSMSKSIVSEEERMDSFLSDNSCDGSDKIDISSDEVEDDGSKQQEEKSVRNEEEKVGKVREEEENKGTEKDLGKTLRADASEFKPLAEVVPEQEELTFLPEGDKQKMNERIVSVPGERTQLLDTASRCNVSGKSFAV